MENVPKGYELVELEDGNWLFTVKDESKGVVTGSFNEVVKYAVSRHGFDINDIEDGVEMMFEYDHSGIHFGIYKSPIFSFDL